MGSSPSGSIGCPASPGPGNSARSWCRPVPPPRSRRCSARRAARNRAPILGHPALTTLETHWQTPFFYDLFAGDVGHTLILGATGAGKSFTLNFLLVQALQYRPRVLILDLGGSYRWLTRFLGGGYLELSPDDGAAGDSFRLRPFSLPPGERTFQFLTGWVTRLLRLGGMETTGDDPTEIRNRIEDLYAFPPGRRDLSSLVRSLPKRMWAAMGRWHGAGTWGKYFDNAADGDDLEFADWQVIDLAGAAEHEDLCEAAMFYLLERLRIALEDPTDIARVKLMVVDEAWRYLKDPAVLSYLAEAAKTWRKKNAALIMATQSAVDVTRTPEAAGLLESMPTKIFLANPNLPEKVGEIFRLNPDEMDTIRSLVPKMELYLKRAGLSAILRLEVDPASYWLYTSNPRDSAIGAPAMIEEHGIATRPGTSWAHGNKEHIFRTIRRTIQCIASRKSCGSCGRALWFRSSCHGRSLPYRRLGPRDPCCASRRSPVSINWSIFKRRCGTPPSSFCRRTKTSSISLSGIPNTGI